ncbi:hypothetical protein ACRALDRAFT_1056097 [Sodiomyces alcalophilus JCM 7366]|uniref:uncharacterized protein n=1 Tax=Sodiomyces alcalophilus JCM 7366 TaxID=591952 RepID=UPI0039B63C1D
MASNDNQDLGASRDHSPPARIPDISGDEPEERSEDQIGRMEGQKSDDLPEAPAPPQPRPNTAHRPGGQPYPRDPSLAPPTTIIGAPLGHNLSAIEAADALVRQWETIREQHLGQSEPEALAEIDARLAQAKADRAELDTVDNKADVKDSLDDTELFRRKAVSDRLDILQKALEESQCEDESANITAAMNCYRDGTITPSSYFALFFAGHLVDFAPSYASFTDDREERLERYAEKHGPGWLWFEPPLARDAAELAGGKLNAQKSTWSQGVGGLCDMRHFHVTMGFKRVRQMGYRSGRGDAAKTAPGQHSLKANLESTSRKRKADDDGTKTRGAYSEASTNAPRLGIQAVTAASAAEADPSAPRHYFRMLLDSGATLPMLYKSDFKLLGIDEKTYPAVSKIPIVSADGETFHSSVYELHISICDTHTAQSLVDPEKPVWPNASPNLGGIMPVGIVKPPRPSLTAQAYVGLSMDDKVIRLANTAEGRNTHRLSGVLPFKACYMQFTPGMNTVWLGEDRRDVLGAHRMPGQMRWEAGSATLFDPGHPRVEWNKLAMHTDGNPGILKMEHDVYDRAGKKVMRMVDVEEEGWHGQSQVSIRDGQDRERLAYHIGSH